MRSRGIYDNPYKYAIECNIPYDLAKIACLKHRHFLKEKRKKAPRCPICDSKRMIYQMGSYEEGYGDYVECDCCGETFEPDEIKNIEYLPTSRDDFDVVLYFSLAENTKAGWMEACGAKTLEEWQNYARREILGRRPDGSSSKYAGLYIDRSRV